MQSGKGLVQNSATFANHPEGELDPSSKPRPRGERGGGAKRIDMVDSYFAVGVTSAAVTSVDHPGLDIGRCASLTGSANRDKARIVSVEEAGNDGNDQDLDNGLVNLDCDKKVVNFFMAYRPVFKGGQIISLRTVANA